MATDKARFTEEQIEPICAQLRLFIGKTGTERSLDRVALVFMRFIERLDKTV